MGRDYERSKPLPMHLNITPESAAHYVRRALASLICFHEPEAAEMKRPCKKCLHVIEPQVKPVTKALTWAITESRVAVGAAVELMVRDADFELVQFQKKNGIVGMESVQGKTEEDAVLDLTQERDVLRLSRLQESDDE